MEKEQLKKYGKTALDVGTDFIPGVSEAKDVAGIAKGLKEGDYTTAGIHAAGLALGAVPVVGDIARRGLLTVAGRFTKKDLLTEGVDDYKALRGNVDETLDKDTAEELFNLGDDAVEKVRKAQSSARKMDDPGKRPFEDSARKLEKDEITPKEFRKEAFADVEKFTEVEELPTFTESVFSLDKNKRKDGILGLNKTIPKDKPLVEAGDSVKARLDIPAYNRYDVYLPKITYKKEGVKGGNNVFSRTMVIQDVKFPTPTKDAWDISRAAINPRTKTATTKYPHATIDGTVAANPSTKKMYTDQEAHSLAKDVINNDDFVHVGYNPDRGGFFYDRATGMPIFDSPLVVQVGKQVFAKKSKLGNRINPKTDTTKAFIPADRIGKLRQLELNTKNLKQGRRTLFNKGGIVPMEQQMEMAFMQEGGLQDDGAMLDAVSGNEVPSGSMDQEVRDDVPAMLSEGEYVVPADVVRYHGVKLFEDLRDEAKIGMGEMEQDGRIGGEPMGDPMEDELPFDISELQTVEEPVREMAEGGEVGPTFTYNPNTRYMQRQNTTSGFDMRVYINPATGRQITIPFFNGQPMSTIPEGFVLASDQPAAQQTTAQPQMQQQRRRSGDSPFGQPDAPTQRGFDAFTTEDWNNYVTQADGQLAAFTANIPILGTLQRLSESSAKAYAEKALETGKHPATGVDLTTAEKTALQNVLNSSITERKSILESIGDLFKGEPDQNMSPRPDYSKPSLDPYNEAAARLAQEQGADDMVETASSDTSTMGAIMAGVNRDKSGDTVGQKFASRADVMSDANDPFMSRMSLEDRLISYEGDYDYQSKNKNETVNGSQVTAYTRDDGVRMYIPFKDGETKDGRQLWTVGLGHQLRGDELDADGMPVKDAYEESLVLENFKKDVADSVASVPSVLKDPTKHHPRVQEAVAEMIFQMGLGNYQEKTGVLGFHNMIAALNLDEPDYRVARKEALDSDWANQTTARANDVAAAIAKGKFFADNARFETPSSRRIEGPQGGATPTTYVPPSGGTGVQDVAPPVTKAEPYTTDAAGFAGDVPPPETSNRYMLERVPEGMGLGPDAYKDPSVTPSFVTAMNQVPQAGAVQPQQSVTPYATTPSGFAGPDFDPSSVDIDPSKTTKYYGGEPLLKAPQFGGQPLQNISNRAMAQNDITTTNRGVPPIATEGGFPPLGTTQAGPTVATTQGSPFQTPQGQAGLLPQANTFDAPIIEPSASNLLKYEPLGQTQLPSSRRGGAGRFPNIAKPSYGGTITGQDTDRFISRRDSVPLNINETIDANMRSAAPTVGRGVNYGGRTPDFENLDTQTEQAFMPSYGTDEFEKARRSRPVIEGKAAVEKSDVNTAVQDAMGKDAFGRYTDIRKEHRRIGAGLSEGDKVKELQREASIRYNINRAKEWGIDPSKMKKEYFDTKGNFKPPKNAPKEILDLKATGISGTGIKVKGHHSPPSKKDPIIPSIVTKPTDKGGNIIKKADKAWQKKLKEKNVSATAFDDKRKTDKSGKKYGGRATGGLVKRRATKKKNT